MLAASARSETVAQHFGTHTHLVRFQAWALSGFMAATAGAFYALYLTAIKPSDFGVLLSISLLLYLICCGRASLFAPALVGLIFVFGPEVFKFSQTGATAIPSIVSGLAVVAVLALFPSGLADLIARGKARPVLRDAFRPGTARAEADAGPERFALAVPRTLRRSTNGGARALKRTEGVAR
jgi:branched-chain amino acid transport system permease protein